mmetsp:Transcript_30150/g.79677  ORF Transcript_30150/g.79677 Transcript_30150/m.79677 type:complete len:238 (-) Transcript_30150:1537-2250(-)
MDAVNADFPSERGGDDSSSFSHFVSSCPFHVLLKSPQCDNAFGNIERGALKFVVRDFVTETRGLRKRLKISQELVQMLKHVLQELVALAHTTDFFAPDGLQTGHAAVGIWDSSSSRAAKISDGAVVLKQWRSARMLQSSSPGDLSNPEASALGQSGPFSLATTAETDEDEASSSGGESDTPAQGPEIIKQVAEDAGRRSGDSMARVSGRERSTTNSRLRGETALPDAAAAGSSAARR